MTARGTSNGNEAGSSYARRRRKAWLIETYRADVDLIWIGTEEQPRAWSVEVPAGRDYRAGRTGGRTFGQRAARATR